MNYIELKKERKKRELSLNQISQDIKISVTKLKALEEGNFDIFPGKFYAKSFLKTYADYLGISVNAIEIFEDENIVPLESKSKQKRKNKFLPVFTGIILIILILVLYGLYYYLPYKSIIKTKYKKTVTVENTIPKFIMVKGIITEPTWVKVVIDDKIVDETTLQAGITKYWKAEKSLKIRIGYTKGIDIYYRKSSREKYRKIDIQEGSVGEINEIEFTNEFSK